MSSSPNEDNRDGQSNLRNHPQERGPSTAAVIAEDGINKLVPPVPERVLVSALEDAEAQEKEANRSAAERRPSTAAVYAEDGINKPVHPVPVRALVSAWEDEET